MKNSDMGPAFLLQTPKEGVLRICIALENPLSWAGFKPEKFGYSGKRTNHYTSKDKNSTLHET
jgi:hypothetical protein